MLQDTFLFLGNRHNVLTRQSFSQPTKALLKCRVTQDDTESVSVSAEARMCLFKGVIVCLLVCMCVCVQGTKSQRAMFLTVLSWFLQPFVGTGLKCLF